MKSKTDPIREQKISPCVSQFIDAFSAFSLQETDRLDAIYASNLIFEDPVHCIKGLEDFRHYMIRLYQDITYSSVVVEEVLESNGVAYINWNMVFSHRKLGPAKKIRFNGISRVEFTEKIFLHQDYFDLGAMLYEHVPVLGRIVRWIKRRLSR